MAINPQTQYPGKIAPASPAYPYGQARNITVPSDGTGTPWEAALVNDLFGMQQELLTVAGIVPSGNPDEVGDSQYLSAMSFISGRVVATLAEAKALTSANIVDGTKIFVLEDFRGGPFVKRDNGSPFTPDNGMTFVFDDDANMYLDRVWEGRLVLADWFEVVGDGVADDQAGLQAAEDFAESVGVNVGLNPDRIYGIGSAINVGLTGKETYLLGGGKNGATIKALSAFTGGLVIVTQGGVDGIQFEGAGLTTVNHVAVFLGTALSTNPLCRVQNILNLGGFYIFLHTTYEYDNALLERITSNVDVGYAGLSLVTNGSIANAASPRINVSLRNPKSTPVAGDDKRYGLIIGRSESARISGLISNFDNNVVHGGVSGDASRETSFDNLLCLDLRSTPSNELWEDEWAATTAYSVGEYRRPTADGVNGHFYVVTTAGTSGASEPTWPTAAGGTVVDGTVTWTEVGESVNVKNGVNQQTRISACRFEDAIVALYHTNDTNTQISSSRLVGESTAFAHSSVNQSELSAVNSLFAGDVKLSGGGGECKFNGIHNTITGDTFGDVPSHTDASVSSGSHTYMDSGEGPSFDGLASLTGSTSRTMNNYDHGVNWGSNPQSGANTASPVINTERYTVIGNKVFCDIDGTVTVNLDTTAPAVTEFSLTVPVAMVSAGNPCVTGSVQLTTGNGDVIDCTVANDSGGNNTSVRVNIPQKGIAVSGDAGAGLSFQGGFSYTKA